MSTKVSQCSGSGYITLESPHKRCIWSGPILKITASDLINSTEFSRRTQLMSECYCRTSPVIIPDKCFSSRRLCSFYHLTSIAQRPRQRFFAGNMFSRLECRNRVLGMHIVGCHHINKINRFGVDGRIPIGCAVLPTPTVGKHF